MTVRVNGVAALAPSTTSCSPGGLDASVRSTVAGSSRRDTVVVSPLLSVAVSRSSRYDG